MVKMFLYLLLLMFVSWDIASTQPEFEDVPKPNLRKTVVRKEADCSSAKQRWELPQCNWHYIAYFPRVFRTGVTENVILKTHGFPNDVNVTVELLDTNKKKKISYATRKAEPGKLISVPLHVPHSVPDYVVVKISGYGKLPEGGTWKFTNKSEQIKVERLGLTILIQTDRPLYKPGQLIRSRVIVVNSDLKPFSGKLDSVSIVSPSDSIMRMWRNTELVDGLASFDLRTSVKPVLGKWKIKVKTKSYYKELTIAVQKYVLPKFQVTLTPPSYITKMSKKATAEICAKYSYGKPVLGKMNATVCLKFGGGSHYYYRRQGVDLSPQCETIARKIDGCTTIEFDTDRISKYIAKFRKRGRYYSEPSVQVTFEASVKESATKVQMSSALKSKQVLSKDVDLDIEAKSVFKPGFPFTFKMLAKRPDGSPVPSIVVKLSATCRGAKDLLKKNVTIIGGVREMVLPPIPFEAKSVSITISYSRAKLYPKESSWRGESHDNKHVQPWYSPSHSYLNIHKLSSPVKIGDNVRITVGYTSVDAMSYGRNISYSMMCAGNLVKSDTLERVFVPARPLYTLPPTTTRPPPTTTTTITTEASENSSKLIPPKPQTGIPLPMVPQVRRIFWPPYWPESLATRPPMPSEFSIGTFTFDVDIGRDMLPSCNMVVYYVRGEEVVADETEIKVINVFENQVTMEFDRKEVKPGSPLKLHVKGAPHSRIAVSAVDKSIHFLAKGNDIKQNDILRIQDKLTIGPGHGSRRNRCGPSWYYERRDFVDSERAFTNAGSVFLSSLRVDVRPCAEPVPYMSMSLPDDRIPVSDSTAESGPVASVNRKTKKPKKKAAKKATRVRTEFPETWLWMDEKLGRQGTRVFDVKVPDTITTWYASGFAISPHAGIGVANPTELRAFQPFFISLNLPYSVIRDEDVTIPAAIFSYLDNSCISVKITLEFSIEFKMIAGPSAKTCLCSGRTSTVMFRIRPKKLGYIKVRVGAETLEDNVCAKGRPVDQNVRAADILVKKLLVEPEGIKEEYTRSTYFCPSTLPGKKFGTEIKLKLPENLVPGSIFTRVSVMGDIMGSTLTNMDQLLAMPYGCGEQNMLKFAPNIFVMNYLNNTKQVNKEIETKALDYMRTGYQRELTYKHDDGSYSAFGSRDKSGSTWLSAFVLKSYVQAQPWIDIDSNEVKQTAKWLMKLQRSDGCFKKVGQLHNKAMKGGVKTPATLTAYVVIALLEGGHSPDNFVIERAAGCVTKVLREFQSNPSKADSYSLSIMAYMYAKLDAPMFEDTWELLDKMAIKEDGMVHWEEAKKEKDPEPIYYYYKARSTDIEQTAYVLLAKLANKGKSAIDSSVSIVRWLSKQRNSLGGWSSTQDTILAMQALSEFAALTFSEGMQMDVTVSTDGFTHNFDINDKNKIVLQRVEDVPVPSTLKISSQGLGCALVQTNVKYNVRRVKVKPTFAVSYNVTSVFEKLNNRKSCRSQIMEVCAKWLGEDESNMAIIDVQMISGFEADPEQFEEVRGLSMNLKDIEVKEKSIMFYYSRISRRRHCVKFQVDQTSNVRDAKPAPIKVYDYYDTEKSAIAMYKFTKEQCGGKRKA